MNADSGRSNLRHRGGLPRLWQGGAEGGKGNPRPLADDRFFCANPKKRPHVICRWDRDCHAGSRLSRPAARAGMGTREETLRQRFCRGAGCGVVFWICRHCDRGHRYCGGRCRRKARRQQRRAANRRHQQSREGRLDHRDRQRVYRKKCRLRRVTDHTSARRPRSVNITEPWTKLRRRPPFGEEFQPRRRLKLSQAAIRPVCIVCGRMRG